MTLAADAFEMLWEGMSELASIEVSYQPLVGTSFHLVAVRGRRRIEVDAGEYTQTFVSDDFIVRVADLLATGVKEPRRRDRIQWTDVHGELHVNEVSLPGNERPYDFADQLHQLMRIHTKEIGPNASR